MKSYNNVTIVGRCIKDVDAKTVSNSNTRTTFTLAVDRPYKDADGKHPADFLNIVAWGKLAEICGDYIKKGCLVLVSGRIQSRSYETNDETKWITEIVAESMNILDYPQTKNSAKSETTAEKVAA